ncbi:NADPH-dependent F420 reductase [Rahnella bruchi]
MKIGILGAGRMGSTIGTVFARLGHEVIFSYSRSQQKLQNLALTSGGRACSPEYAVKQSNILVLAVHWTQLDDVLSQAGDLRGKIVISCTNPLNISDTELVVAHTDSGAETVARKLPGAHVVAAFQATPSEVLLEVFEGKYTAPRPSMVYCGNDRESKKTVRELLKQFGFEPVDAGPLKLARYIEPFAMLATELAYGTPHGPKWVYNFGRYS